MKNTLSINQQPFMMLSNLELGLARGSIWSNLYIPYKYENSYVNDSTTPMMEVKHLMQVYRFALIDLTLFRLTHPESKEAMDAYTKIDGELSKLEAYMKANIEGGLLCGNTSIV